jgi:hypothetical protein
LTGHINGAVDKNVASGSVLTTAGTTYFGFDNDGSGLRGFDGTMDEVRVSNVARSADWITAEYNSQKSPSTFYAVGGAWSQPDCRVAPFGPNQSRTIQNTATYDVQTSDNPVVPGTDSRTVKPTDSRIALIIPENSRNDPSSTGA